MNLGVWSSNLSGRTSLRDFPCESHGIHTAINSCSIKYALARALRWESSVTLDLSREGKAPITAWLEPAASTTHSRANGDFPARCALPRFGGVPRVRFVSVEENLRL
jgi:hypothetical protein